MDDFEKLQTVLLEQIEKRKKFIEGHEGAEPEYRLTDVYGFEIDALQEVLRASLSIRPPHVVEVEGE